VKLALQTMSLEGVAELIRCPTLILHGEADIQIPVAAARWTYDRITNAQKQLIIYPAGQPGSTHCQLDSPLIAQRDIGDFLDCQLRTSQHRAARSCRDKPLNRREGSGGASARCASDGGANDWVSPSPPVPSQLVG
jgi:dienelactone hydrolase